MDRWQQLADKLEKQRQDYPVDDELMDLVGKGLSAVPDTSVELGGSLMGGPTKDAIYAPQGRFDPTGVMGTVSREVKAARTQTMWDDVKRRARETMSQRPLNFKDAKESGFQTIKAMEELGYPQNVDSHVAVERMISGDLPHDNGFVPRGIRRDFRNKLYDDLYEKTGYKNYWRGPRPDRFDPAGWIEFNDMTELPSRWPGAFDRGVKPVRSEELHDMLVPYRKYQQITVDDVPF